MLIQLGYALPKYGADSEFGAETEKALLAFQKKAGLEADGKYGDKQPRRTAGMPLSSAPAWAGYLENSQKSSDGSDWAVLDNDSIHSF